MDSLKNLQKLKLRKVEIIHRKFYIFFMLRPTTKAKEKELVTVPVHEMKVEMRRGGAAAWLLQRYWYC